MMTLLGLWEFQLLIDLGGANAAQPLDVAHCDIADSNMATECQFLTCYWTWYLVPSHQRQAIGGCAIVKSGGKN